MKRLIVFSLLLGPASVYAQKGLEPAEILKPLGDQWTTYSGDYTGKRYSALKAVNASTVNRLSLAWVSRFATACGPTGTANTGGGGGFGGRGGGEAAAPIIVGGLGKGDLNTCGAPRLGGGILMVDGVIYMSCARQRLGGGCARRHGALALLLEDPGRHAHGQPRHGHVAQQPLPGGARQLPDLPGCQNRQGEMEEGDFQLRPAVLLLGRSDCSRRSRAGRHRQRHGRSRFPAVVPSGNGRAPVDLLHGADDRRRSRGEDLGESRCGAAWRRPTVDSRSLRSGNPPLHVRHRQSDTGIHHRARRGRQPIHVLAGRGECGYRQDGVVLPDFAARHTRLGFDADPDSCRHAIQWPHAQGGDDGGAQRLLLRSRPGYRRASGYGEIRPA